MSKRAKLYLTIVSALGLSLGFWRTIVFFQSLFGVSNAREQLYNLILLFFLCILCRALPIYIADDQALDVSFISVLSSLLVLGADATVAILLLTTPFVVECGAKKGAPVRHIFNTPPFKTAFNVGNLILSIYLPGLAFALAGGQPGVVRIPATLLPTVVFVFLSLVLNATLLIGLFTIDRARVFFPTLRQMLFLVMPNMAAVAPMGLLMAALLLMPNGSFLAFIFLVPLLLARYAFKLYLSSRQEYYQMVQALVATIEAKDKYTEGHSKRVSTFSEEIAISMHLSVARLEQIRVAALLHDIGKIGIDDAVLKKGGPLSQEELTHIQQHPDIGAHILENTDFDPRIREIVLHHHERYDGKGYPNQTGKDSTPLESFILGVADAYDAMTSDRSYRKGLPEEKALTILKEERGRQFHPAVVDAFLHLVARRRQEEARQAEKAALAEKKTAGQEG